MPVRVIFSTGSLYVLDVAVCFELAAAAGFDGVEVMADERWSSRDPDYLARLVAAHRQPVLAVHTPFSPRVPGWPDGGNEVRRIERSVALAEALRAEVVVVHLPPRRAHVSIHLGRRTWRLPWLPVDHPVKRWIEAELPRAQARTRVKIAVENMPARRILGRDVDPVWWSDVPSWSRVHDWLTLDTTHWATWGVNPLDAYRAAGPRVCHVHLSNYNGHEHRLPHKGRLDLKRFLRALAADGFAGTVSLELQPGALVFTEPKALRRHLHDSLQFCREHLR